MPSEQTVPSAERLFTDREDYFKAFQDALARMSEKRYNVLHYYGLGGVGKSRLKAELSKSLDTSKYLVSSRLNFQIPEYRSPNAALYAIYSDLRRQKVRFPAFEIAYAVHWQKLNPQLKLSEKTLPFIEEGGFLSDAIALIGDVPVAGMIPKIASMLHKLQRINSEWWTKEGEKELRTLDALEAFKVEELLPYYFALDIKSHQATENSPLVIFVDTYEALWSTQGERKKELFYTRDKWVRDLVGNLPNVLWVLFGRERLRWDEIKDDNWEDFVEQHLLGELASDDADRFLISCRIDNAAIRRKMIETSKGLPFYLDLQVDTYNQKVSQGATPSAKDFSNSYDRILTRFCQYLDPSEIETLKLLAFARNWDAQLFRDMVREFQTGYAATAFDEILRFSFVDASRAPDACSIHQIMREHLQSAVTKEYRQRICEFLFAYNEGKLRAHEEGDFIEISPKVAAALDETIYHKRQIVSPDDFYAWLLATSQKTYGESQSRVLQEALESAFVDLVEEEHDLLLIRICAELSRLYGWQVNLQLAEKYILAGNDLYQRIVDRRYSGDTGRVEKEAEDLLAVRIDLLCRQAQLLSTLDRNVDAYDKYQQALRECGAQTSAMDMWNYASFQLEIGRLPQAESYFFAELREALDAKNREHVALSTSRIGIVYFRQKLFGESLTCWRFAREEYVALKGVDHKYARICQAHVAEILVRLGRSDEAGPIIDEVVAWYRATYGDGSPELAEPLRIQAECAINAGRAYDAFKSLRYCRSLVRERYGSSHATAVHCLLLEFGIVQRALYDGVALESMGFPPDEAQSTIAGYALAIRTAERAFHLGFTELSMNFGWDSIVIELYAAAMDRYYAHEGIDDRRKLLSDRITELMRVGRSQFEIRSFGRLPRTEIVGAEKDALLSKLRHFLGVDSSTSVSIYSIKPPFYRSTTIYSIAFSRQIEKFVCITGDEIRFLDWTNAPIYEIGTTDFMLSPETVEEYVLFFFDAVKGRHGKFYVPASKDDLPLRGDVDVHPIGRRSISTLARPVTIMEASPTEIVAEVSIFFKDSLFSAIARVDAAGIASLSDEKLRGENLPVSVEPQYGKLFLSRVQQLEKVIVFFSAIAADAATALSESDGIKHLLAELDNLEKIAVQATSSETLEPEVVRPALDYFVNYIETRVRPALTEFHFKKAVDPVLDVIRELCVSR